MQTPKRRQPLGILLNHTNKTASQTYLKDGFRDMPKDSVTILTRLVFILLGIILYRNLSR
jgi:hypothetical protein